jgi:septal ring factor EnvC (AmiA/AmiB activator)
MGSKCCVIGRPRSLIKASRTPDDGTRKRDVEIGRRVKETPQSKAEGGDDAQMTKVWALLGVLTILVVVAFAAGCGTASDKDQARQGAKKKVESKSQDVRQEAKEKVQARKQEAKNKVEALQEKVNDLKKDVDDLKKEVQDLQKKINAHEQKEQQQQINQLKKALNELKKKVGAQQQ